MPLWPSQSLAFEPLLQSIDLTPHIAAPSAPASSATRPGPSFAPTPRRLAGGAVVTHHFFRGSAPRRTRLGDDTAPLTLEELQRCWPPRQPARLPDHPPTPPRVAPRSSAYSAFSAADAGRGHCDAPADSDSAPLLAVSRFVPHRQKAASRAVRRITLLLTHGAGFHKEMSEPMLQHLVHQLSTNIGGRIEVEEAWCIDMPGHGDSRTTSGAGPWPIDGKDYMRDVLTFVALYMPRTADASTTTELPAFLVPDAEAVRLLSASPNGLAAPPVPTRANLVGIGHSIGGETMVGVALHAPELFCSIAVIEPIILDADTYPFGTSLPLARFALKKEWRWKSAEEAEKHFAEHPVYGRYRQDVRQAFLRHGTTQSAGVMLKANPYVEAIAYLDHQTVASLAPRGHFFPPIPALWITSSRPLMYSAKTAPPVETVRRLAGRFAGMQVEVLPGGHNLPYDEPDLLGETLSRFIAAGNAARL